MIVGAPRRDLLGELVLRDMRLRYRRSALGLAWSQLGPLVLLGVLTFVFSHVVPLGIPSYALFVYIGLLAWTWFAAAIVGVTESIVSNRDLVRRPGFPPALLPVATVTTHLVHFALALPIVVVVSALDGGLHPSLLALPLVVAVQFLLLLGPGYLFAAVNVELRDVSHLIGVLLVPLFYATPVFYDVSSVPARYRTLYGLNPVNRLVTAYRDVFLYGRWPDPLPLVVIALVAVALVLFGRRVFTAGADRFAEELG